MANLRIRGKIPHAEWPKIAQRFTAGESLTAIARDYQCTAPAIRYIVRRTTSGVLSSGVEGNAVTRRSVTAPPRSGRSGETYSVRRQAEAEAPIASAIWSRVNGDITNFLAAVDELFDADTERNRNTLLGATDRLLRASARTRMDLERAFEAKLPGPADTKSTPKARKAG